LEVTEIKSGAKPQRDFAKDFLNEPKYSSILTEADQKLVWNIIGNGKSIGYDDPISGSNVLVKFCDQFYHLRQKFGGQNDFLFERFQLEGYAWNPIYLEWFYKVTECEMPESICDILKKYTYEDTYYKTMLQSFNEKSKESLDNLLLVHLKQFKKTETDAKQIYDNTIDSATRLYTNILTVSKLQHNKNIAEQTELCEKIWNGIKLNKAAGYNTFYVPLDKWHSSIATFLDTQNIQITASGAGVLLVWKNE